MEEEGVPKQQPAGNAGDGAHGQQARLLVDDVLAFLFPSNKNHPRPLLRLFLLAEHGPLVRNHSVRAGCFCKSCRSSLRELSTRDEAARKLLHGRAVLSAAESRDARWLCPSCQEHCQTQLHLKGGRRGLGVVSDTETARMEQDVIEQDLLRAYGHGSSLTAAEQNDFLKNLPGEKRRAPRLSPEEILRLLDDVPGAKTDKSMSFHDFRATADRIRAERVVELGMASGYVDRSKRLPPVPPPPGPLLTKAMATMRRVPDSQLDRVTSRLLHAGAYKVHGADSDEGRQPPTALRSTMFLMRNLEPDCETNWKS